MRIVLVLVAAMLVSAASAASAQTGASGLAGVVRDASGAVLPGVTVEASSPALIEKVRTATTDDQGQYKVVDLRPGLYTVTFALPGFTVVKREGIELPANFTATINAELALGALEETITVSGGTPLVDLQNTAVRNVISAKVLDAVPTAKNFNAYAVMTVGVNAVGNNPSAEGAKPQDVGGTKGDTMVFMTYHGSAQFDAKITVDGFETNFVGGARLFIPNPYAAQETSLDLGGGTAEHRASGVQLNIIPKSGGNAFSGDLAGTYADDNFQGSNLSEEVAARGLTASTINRLQKHWDTSAVLGGPLQRDRLWFFTSHRQWGGGNYVAGLFYNKTPHALTYTPDLDRPAVNDFRSHSSNARLTWQALEKQKFTFSYDWQQRCDCHRDITSLRSPEATNYRTYDPVDVLQSTWTFPASNRLLFQGGVQFIRQQLNVSPQPEVAPDAISILEESTGFSYRAMIGTYSRWRTDTLQPRASASYVTGSHAFKVGVDSIFEWSKNASYVPANLNYTFRNGVPVSLTQFAEPHTVISHTVPDLGLFVQDQWTIDRLTLNLGVRFDYLKIAAPPQTLAAVAFRPSEVTLPDVSCGACATDIGPRLSAAYDLFGTGRTALKVTAGRYTISRASVTNYNPANAIIRSASRAWTDSNGNFVPDCDLASPLPNGECRQLSNLRFGQQGVETTVSEDVRNDFRRNNWQLSASIEQQLLPGFAVNVGYFRTSWYNFTATDNRAIEPSDFDEFCVILPQDTRLPGGGGNRLCGLYDLKPDKFGRVDNLVTRADHFGKQTDIYNGVDLNATARLPRGAVIAGGFSTGRQSTNGCFVVDSPQSLLFCDVKPPYQTQYKVYAIYPLPWDLQVSGTFQSLPGIPIAASYVATNADVSASLGRSLSGGRTTVTIPNIIAPQTMFENRSSQVDLRLTRSFKVGAATVRGNFDLYNALNASPILATNTRYGRTWLQPTVILDARLFKFSAQLSF